MPQQEIPRRAMLEQFTPAERAIYDAVALVEEMGADVRLTKAVVLLGQARDAVADFVDNVPAKPTAADQHVVTRAQLVEWLKSALHYSDPTDLQRLVRSIRDWELSQAAKAG